MQSIVKTSNTQDFLALVPQLVGFEPERSLVLVAFRGNRTCGALRADLPTAGGAAAYERVANTIVGMVCKISGVDAVVPVIYTDDTFRGTGSIPHEELMSVVTERARLSGFVLRDALCVARDAWASFLDHETSTQGRPLTEIAASPAAARVPEDARGALASPRDGARLPEVGVAERERVARALRRLEVLLGLRGVGSSEQARSFIDLAARLDELEHEFGPLFDPVAVVEASLAWKPESLDTVRTAALLLVLQSPPNRDQAMVQYAFGAEAGSAAFESNLRYAAVQKSTGKSMDDIVAAELDDDSGLGHAEHAIAEMMLGRTTRRPDVRRVGTAIELLKHLVSCAPRHARPAPLCMLAWLNWGLGRGSVAGIHLDEAIAIDREYGMAQVLQTLFNTGVLPEWAFHPPLSA